MTSLATISVGPKDRGRSYGVLDHSLKAGDFARLRPGLEDFALALAAWADRGLPRFVALAPVGREGRDSVLWRARYLGSAELGTVAIAHGLVIPAEVLERLEGRAHRLLPLLSEPDGGPFGKNPIHADIALAGPALAGPVVSAFGLEWRDQVVELTDGADPETVLMAVLGGIVPVAQAARIDGWATTGVLEASGGFDPDRAFRLIVRPIDEPRGLPLAGRRTVRLSGGRIATPPEPAPAVWRAWQRIQAVIVTMPGLSSAPWKAIYASLPVDRVVSLALLQAVAGLGLNERLDLIAAAVRQTRPEPDIAEDVEAAVGRVLLSLAATADTPEAAVHYLEAGLTEAGRFGAGAARVISAEGPLDHTIGTLDKLAIERALDHGLLDRLAAEGPAPAIALFEPKVLTVLLGRCIARAGEGAAMRGLAVGLIAHLARSERSRRAAAAGIGSLLTLPPEREDVGLATVAVADLARQLSPDQRGLYAARALSPVVRGDVRLDIPDFREAMRAVTRILGSAA